MQGKRSLKKGKIINSRRDDKMKNLEEAKAIGKEIIYSMGFTE